MEIFNGTNKEWNDLLINISDYNFYQSYEWGEFKKNVGWKVKRFIEKVNKEYAIAQIFEKQIPFLKTKFLWIPGGPLLSDINNAKLLELFVQNIENEYKSSSYVIRYNQQISRIPSLVNSWRKMGYLSPIFPITFNMNIILDLNEINSLEKQSHPKYRYSIRKAKTNSNLELVMGRENLLSESLDLYSKMMNRKNVKQNLSNDFLIKSFNAIKDNIHIIMVKQKKIPISFVMLIHYNKKAFYFLGATNEIGKKHFAAYLIFNYITDWCRKNNIQYFDLCGIDPLVNYDTYRFKKRTGGSLIEYIGEREKATSKFLRFFCNLGIRLKGIGS